MKDICDRLDAVLLNAFPNDGIKFAGLCQLVLKGNQPHPVTIEDNKQIAIDQKWDVLCYHRLNGKGDFLPDEEQDFGRSTGRTRVQPIRTIIAHKVEKGEEWIDYFLNGWPESISVTDAAGTNIYDFVDIESMGLDVDQEGIYTTEFGGGDYEKHRIPWNIYAIEWNAEYIRC